MTRQIQRSRERKQLDLMIEKLGLKVDGDIRARESPDFEFKLLDGDIIACEVTDVRDEGIAAVAGVVRRWKRTARDRLVALGASVWAHAVMREEAAAALNKKSDVLRREAEQIAAIAAADALGLAPGGAVKHDEQDLRARGIHHVRHVLVQPYPTPLATWGTMGRGQRRRLIQEAIDNKAPKLPTYRQAVPHAKQWLLVVAGWGGHGASVDAAEAEGDFVSQFDKTIFLDGYEGICLVLSTPKRP